MLLTGCVRRDARPCSRCRSCRHCSCSSDQTTRNRFCAGRRSWRPACKLTRPRLVWTTTPQIRRRRYKPWTRHTKDHDNDYTDCIGLLVGRLPAARERGLRIEQFLCFQRKSLRYTALGTGCTLTAVSRPTQPSTLRGTVNEYQPHGWVLIQMAMGERSAYSSL